MELSTGMKHFSNEIGMAGAAEVLQKAGFRYVDYTPELKNFEKAKFQKELEIMWEHGIEVYQSHAPFNRYKSCGSAENHKKLVELSLEAAVEASSRYLVVHGDEYDFESQSYSTEKALQYNYDYYAPIVEKAVRKGINIAFENVFQDSVPYPRYGSKAEELIALIDKFSCPQVCCCWDFGHGAAAYQEKQQEAIIAVGNRIRCTHVHDNYLKADLHLIPLMGKINWKECMKAFRDVAKAKVLSFELHYGHVTENTAFYFAKLLYATGCELVSY